MFTISERRSRLVFGWLAKQAPYSKPLRLAICLSAVMPWVVGTKASAPASIRPTVGLPQDSPTSHGNFPMGAYAFYMIDGKTHVYALDWNEKILRAAEDVIYETCVGEVPILNTPMYNYLELAVRLDGLSPKIVNTPHEADCPYVYADARSLFLDRPPGSRDLLLGASLAASFQGQAILSLGHSPTDFGILLRALADRFFGREFGFYAEPANTQFESKEFPNGGAVYALSTGECAITPDAFGAAVVGELSRMRIYVWNVPAGYPSQATSIICTGGGQAGQITLTFPNWMGK